MTKCLCGCALAAYFVMQAGGCTGTGQQGATRKRGTPRVRGKATTRTYRHLSDADWESIRTGIKTIKFITHTEGVQGVPYARYHPVALEALARVLKAKGYEGKAVSAAEAKRNLKRGGPAGTRAWTDKLLVRPEQFLAPGQAFLVLETTIFTSKHRVVRSVERQTGRIVDDWGITVARVYEQGTESEMRTDRTCVALARLYVRRSGAIFEKSVNLQRGPMYDAVRAALYDLPDRKR
jgi:hypothetical protein